MQFIIKFSLILIVSFLPVKSYAVKDFILRKSIHKPFKSLRLQKLESNYPFPLQASLLQNDDYNSFYYTEHFRIIVGNYYKDSPSVVEFIEKVKEFAEIVWEKEIEELNFNTPRNSDQFFIDIYIANKKAYNPEEGDYVNISPSYAGYMSEYNNGTPYFVINPSLSEDMLKITLAHEFFHTIQFSYYDFIYISDDEWEKNCWWLEATAVWMESIVFPEIKDYLTFLIDWINTSYLPIDTLNGEHEYGEAVIPIYLYENDAESTVELIKNSFETYSYHKDFVNFLEQNIPMRFKEYSLSEVLTNIINCLSKGMCISDELSHFIEFKQVEGNIEGYYSLFPSYLDHADFIDYTESPFGALDVFDGLDKRGVIVLKKKGINVNLPALENRLISLKQININGWAFLCNLFSKEISPEDMGIVDYIVWVYDEDNWKAFSDKPEINDVLKKFLFLRESKYINPNEVFWIKASGKIELTNIRGIIKKIKISYKNWSMINFGIIPISVEELKNIITTDFILWTYMDGKWMFYSSDDYLNKIAHTYNIQLLSTVGGKNGYWIRTY